MISVGYYPIDNKIYLVLNKKEYQGNTYVFLANEMDSADVMIRKVENDNILKMLDNKEELINVLSLFIK